MPKYFLRQKTVVQLIQNAGNSETPDTTAITVLEKDSAGNVSSAKGTTVPTDTESGFAVGCEFIDTNAAAGAQVFLNEGSTSSCDFNVVGTASNVVDGVTAGDGMTGGGTEGSVTLDVVGGNGLTANTNDIDVNAEVMTDLITMALAGTVAAFGFPFNVMVSTEAAAAFAKVEDGAVFANLAVSGGEAGYASNYQLWPDTELENDAVYFGGAAAFGVLDINVSATVATYGADSVQWEYYNGSSWASLTIIYDETDTNDQSGTRPFMQDGQIIFSAPTDWASTSVDGQAAFWVRARIKSGFNVTQIPLFDSVEHGLATSPTASEMPAAGTLGRGRMSFVTVSGANNDTKIILCNLTKGTASAIKTLTQALTANEVADFALTCDQGDQLAVYVTQEDGTTEFANGWLEVQLAKTGAL